MTRLSALTILSWLLLVFFLFIMSQNVLGLHVFNHQLLLEIKASSDLVLKQTETGQGYGLPPPPLSHLFWVTCAAILMPHPGTSAQGNGESELVRVRAYVRTSHGTHPFLS